MARGRRALHNPAMDPALLQIAQTLLIGLSIAAPVGQIGVLAIQRTLQ